MYLEIPTKKRIEEKHAFGYALEQILNNPKEKEEFIEWFYSGNWIKVEEEAEEETEQEKRDRILDNMIDFAYEEAFK